MQLRAAVNNAFVQLTASLQQLTPAEYIQPSRSLFQNTIGQHVRHIIELFQCLDQGYESGVVNYENRKRDPLIETDKDQALELLRGIYAGLDKPDKPLMLQATYDDEATEPVNIHSNYYREIAYNLEHTIHHMALIRVGIGEVSAVQLPDEYGVASSTVKYRRECAQ